MQRNLERKFACQEEILWNAVPFFFSGSIFSHYLQYFLDRFVIQHCQHIALCFCTIALACRRIGNCSFAHIFVTLCFGFCLKLRSQPSASIRKQTVLACHTRCCQQRNCPLVAPLFDFRTLVYSSLERLSCAVGKAISQLLLFVYCNDMNMFSSNSALFGQHCSHMWQIYTYPVQNECMRWNNGTQAKALGFQRHFSAVLPSCSPAVFRACQTFRVDPTTTNVTQATGRKDSDTRQIESIMENGSVHRDLLVKRKMPHKRGSFGFLNVSSFSSHLLEEFFGNPETNRKLEVDYLLNDKCGGDQIRSQGNRGCLRGWYLELFFVSWFEVKVSGFTSFWSW